VPASPELTTLTALAQALARSASLAESLDAALATVAELLGLETGWVWLLDEREEQDGAAPPEPRLAAARALPEALREHPDAMRGDCYCLRTFRAGDLRGAANVNVVWCSRIEMVVHDSPAGRGATALRCHASVPLVVGERRLGMLNVASRDWRVLSEDELHLLTTAGALVSLAIERARLEAASARAAAAEERNRLAREIHDTIAQSLAALTMQLEVADARATAGGDARMTDTVRRALGQSRATLEEARRSVLELREAPTGARTLREALETVARSALDAAASAPERRVLEVRVTADALDEERRALPAALRTGLCRIAQQALANVVGHARATRVEIRLTREPDEVRLRIEDDGAGFDPAAVAPDRFGLVGMTERARLLGGTLTVESAPGAGTAIDVVVPLPVRAPASGGAVG
jgi:two-component system NarL family sensor kinase